MPISGSAAENFDLLKKLDPTKLMELVADILFRRGHRQTKIVDGPGDGCRDIQSVTTSSKKHLTQCKHHEDITKTVTSKEAGELPLGLVRFNYGIGLFVTNARMSSQAKREYLDNYPTLELEFIEGSELAPIVLGDTILRALWWDGHSLEQVSHVVVMASVGRNIAKDRPIALKSFLPPNESTRINVSTEQGDLSLLVQFQGSTVSVNSFTPYRPPRVKTFGEPWAAFLNTIELLISGSNPLSNIEIAVESVARHVMGMVKMGVNDDSMHIALRFGTAYLAPLAGEQAGARIELPMRPTTYVLAKGEIETKSEWMLPVASAGWILPDRISALEANWVRWYNSKLDLCLDLTLLSPPDEYAKPRLEEKVEYFARYWAQSIFALLPDAMVTSMLKKHESQFELDQDENQAQNQDEIPMPSHCCPARVRRHIAVDLLAPDTAEDGINPPGCVDRTG